MKRTVSLGMSIGCVLVVLFLMTLSACSESVEPETSLFVTVSTAETFTGGTYEINVWKGGLNQNFQAQVTGDTGDGNFSSFVTGIEPGDIWADASIFLTGESTTPYATGAGHTTCAAVETCTISITLQQGVVPSPGTANGSIHVTFDEYPVVGLSADSAFVLWDGGDIKISMDWYDTEEDLSAYYVAGYGDTGGTDFGVLTLFTDSILLEYAKPTEASNEFPVTRTTYIYAVENNAVEDYKHKGFLGTVRVEYASSGADGVLTIFVEPIASLNIFSAPSRSVMVLHRPDSNQDAVWMIGDTGNAIPGDGTDTTVIYHQASYAGVIGDTGSLTYGIDQDRDGVLDIGSKWTWNDTQGMWDMTEIDLTP